jgi:predicted aspartyl protease
MKLTGRMRNNIPVFYLILLLISCPCAPAAADTVYLKNGRSVEGIAKELENGSVEINMGFGSITCDRGQIKKIVKSSAEETSAINSRWEEKKAELESRAEDFVRERDKRFAEYGEWARESEERKASKAEVREDVPVTRDQGSNSILVETMLDDKVKAILVLDTGASVVVLSKRIGRELGILEGGSKNDVVTLRLAGDRKIEARMVALKSVKVKNAEVKGVLAAVLLEDYANPGFKDGLLGMTFLKHFNIKVDLKNMKLLLERLKS